MNIFPLISNFNILTAFEKVASFFSRIDAKINQNHRLIKAYKLDEYTLLFKSSLNLIF